jgi:hypothetical protein
VSPASGDQAGARADDPREFQAKKHQTCDARFYWVVYLCTLTCAIRRDWFTVTKVAPDQRVDRPRTAPRFDIGMCDPERIGVAWCAAMFVKADSDERDTRERRDHSLADKYLLAHSGHNP